MFRQDFTCPALLENQKVTLPVRGYHPFLPAFPNSSGFNSSTTGLVRVRSPLLTESHLMSFPLGTEMFQFPRFASPVLCIQTRDTTQGGGFPHSEIRGSKGIGPSPRLIAACHVLHRLSVPRHPLNALMRLTYTQLSSSFEDLRLYFFSLMQKLFSNPLTDSRATS